MMETGYSLADIAAATGNSGNNNDSFGGNNGWWIILLLLALGRGYGFGGNGGGQGYSQPIVIDSGRSGGCGCSPCATQADLAAGFNNSAVLANLNDLQLGLANGFAAINNALCTLGYNIQGGFNGMERSFCNLGYQLKDCCCETQRLLERGFADTNYNLATQACDTRHAIYTGTRDIIENANANSRAILDAFTAQRIADKDDRIAAQQQKIFALELAASQANQNAFITANQQAQTAELIRRLGADCPQPAFLVNGPTPINFPVNACGQVQFGGNCCNPCAGSGF